MIKKVIIFMFILVSLLGNSYAQSQTANLEVKITNIPSEEGQMIISLHQGDQNFPKSPIVKIIGKIINGTSTVEFEGINYGDYAITVVHDENKNGKMDFNFFHIPKEDAAASNNAKGFMGPPKYEDAKFEVMESKMSQVLELTKIHSSLN